MGRDDRLARNGVFFQPWVGERYEEGFCGRRLLVLGESHYDTWEDEIHKLGQTFTRGCVEEVLSREGGARLWKAVEQALLNEPLSSGWCTRGGEELWRQFAFYNFVQTPVSGNANSKPRDEQFNDSHSQFLAVLEELRPERVLVCGTRLWSHMPPTPYDNGYNRLYLHGRVQGYELADGTAVWCLVLNHPSRAFSWRRWHPVITAFVENPARAV